MALAAVFTACEKEAVEEYVPQEIRLGAEFPLDEAVVTTRNENQGLNNDILETGTNVGVFIYYTGEKNINADGYGYKNLSYNSAAATGDGKKYCDLNLATGTRTPYYPSDKDKKIDFYAFSPRSEVTVTEAELSSYATTKASFTTKADQTTDENYRLSDFIWGKNVNTVNAETYRTQKVIVPMNHMLSKICINLTEGHSMANKLTGAKVVIHGVNLNGLVDLADGTMITTGTTLSDVTLTTGLTNNRRTEASAYPGGGGTPTDAVKHYTYPTSCVVIPQKVNASKTTNFNFLSITLADGGTSNNSTTGGTTYDYVTSAIVGDATNGFQPGKVYTFNITLNATGIQLTTNVTDWISTDPTAGQATYRP